MKLAGLNPYLYEMVDLRNLDENAPETQLQDRVRMGVARAGFLTAPALRQVPVTKRALVVGGGISGLESALALSREGYPVTVVEKEQTLGGNGGHIRKTWQGYDVQAHLKELVDTALQDENITVMTEATVKTNRGFGGRFVATVNQKGSEKEVSCGAVILAPGGTARKPEDYLYGRHKNVCCGPNWIRSSLKTPPPWKKLIQRSSSSVLDPGAIWVVPIAATSAVLFPFVRPST